MRISSFLWVQDCQSSDADGNVVERRYPGEKSFVLLTGRVYYGGGFGVEDSELHLFGSLDDEKDSYGKAESLS